MSSTNQKTGIAEVSQMAGSLIGSEIIKLAAEINARMQAGEHIFNFTIGDFDPKVFPIPALYEEEIIKAYRQKQTNYPAANGLESLRKAVQQFLYQGLGLDYDKEEILISGGGRPLIYATYLTLINPGDKILYPVPSWNNNHYTHLCGGVGIEIETTSEHHFMPVPDDIRPYIQEATLIALCSPLNPTGTVFSRDALKGISEMVVAENKRREGRQKPLYILYDQLYWTLTYGQTEHFNPVTLVPEVRPYVVFIDGMSKAFAATGVRVGWAFGPLHLMQKMRAILSHIGAWSPKPEQVATAAFLGNGSGQEAIAWLHGFKEALQQRLDRFYAAFTSLQSAGFPVDCIAPQAAIYLTVRIDLRGAITQNGQKLNTMADVTKFLLEEASLALVPFYAFGADPESPWFRLSIGTCTLDDVDTSMTSLKNALSTLKF